LQTAKDRRISARFPAVYRRLLADEHNVTGVLAEQAPKILRAADVNGLCHGWCREENRSASVVFSAAGEVLDVVFQSGQLVQSDASGGHRWRRGRLIY
jgi:hypothetical protein